MPPTIPLFILPSLFLSAILTPAPSLQVEVPDVTLLQRHILTAEPRVTRYLIEWDNMLTSAAMSESSTPEQQALAGGEAAALGEIAQPQFQAALEQPTSVSVTAE